jgi:hypothetical protein
MAPPRRSEIGAGPLARDGYQQMSVAGLNADQKDTLTHVVG